MSRTRRGATHTQIQIEVGNRLRWARELVYENRAEFARLIGSDRSTIQKIEDGNRAPSIFNILDFSHALHVTPNYLLMGDMRGIDGAIAAALAAEHPELGATARILTFSAGNADKARDGGMGPRPITPPTKS